MELLDDTGAATRVVAAARRDVAALGQRLWAAARPAELLETVEELERLRSTLAAVQARVVAEIEVTEATKTRQWPSTADWVTHVAGGRRGHGNRVLRTARALAGDRARTLAALEAGLVSPEHAEVIAASCERLPVSPEVRAEAEQVLLTEAAGGLDASELAAAAARLLEVVDPEGAARADEAALSREERSAHLGRGLSITDDGLGGVRVRGRGTVEDAAVLKAALHALAAPVPASPCETHPDCPRAAADGRDHGARLWDALVETARRSLDADGRLVPQLPDQHGTRSHVAVTLDWQQLVTGVGTATLVTGEAISVAAVRRLACDAGIIPVVLGGHGEVLDVGRTQRLVTPGIWKALVARDAHCRFPGCRRLPIACDAHHLTHWADGGATSLDNLVLLCRAHHTAIHQTPWQVRLNPLDRHPEFRAPPGRRQEADPGWIRHPRARTQLDC